MEVQRARTGAGSRMIRTCAFQLGCLSAERVDVDHVAAKIVDVGEAIVGREGCEMRVRGLLPVGVGAVHGVVLAPHQRAELAVGNFEAGCAAPAVVGRNENAAGVVDGAVACALAGGILTGKLLEFSACNAEAG